MAFCIPKQVADTLKKAASRGEVKLESLYQMTSEQRREFFEGYTDKLNALEINAGFEQAMASSQKSALETWVNNTFSAKEKAKRQDMIDKIQELDEAKVLTPTEMDMFLQDMVSSKLGLTVTAEEAGEISKKSKELQVEYDKPLDKFGNRDVSYFAKRKEMVDYMKSLQPSSKLKVLTGVVGKGAMLFNIKSALINIVGNTLQGIEQSFERRVASNQYVGRVDKQIVKEYTAKVSEIYKASRYDLSRMYEYSEGQKVLGEKMVHSEGKGAVRKLGRIYEDIVFDKLLGAPDVYFARLSFIDAINLASTKIAKSEGLRGEALKVRATELFTKAAAVETNGEGIMIREQGIADANFATFQNESTYTKVALGIRGLLNDATGDFRVGDLLMPFVKTPANVAGVALDVAGLGLIRGAMKLRTAIPAYRAGNPQPMQEATRLMVRTGLGSTAAFILSLLIDPDDFVGFWPTDPKEQELLKLQGANSNSIRIGGKWVSLDYFGFLGGALVGILYARKYGGNLPDIMFNYALGAGKEQLLQVPGVEESNQLISDLQKMQPGDPNAVKELSGESLLSTVDFIRSRSIPGIVNDIAKALDDSEREVDWKNPLQKVQASIPGARTLLPEKVDIFGEVIKGEPWWSSILFGARMKTNRDGRITDELTKLDDAGNLPSITRPDKTSPRFKSLKEQIGDKKFEEAMSYFRNEYKTQIDRLIRSSSYNNMNEETKVESWNSIKRKLMDRTLKKYNYKK